MDLIFYQCACHLFISSNVFFNVFCNVRLHNTIIFSRLKDNTYLCLFTILIKMFSIFLFVSNDSNPVILISLSNFGAFVASGINIAATITIHAMTVDHLCFAMNVPSYIKILQSIASF